MHFDDRLVTVLRHRASGDRAARTQFRQLLDLLGSRSAKRDGERDESLMAAAWLRLGALGEMIPAKERTAMIREPGLRFRNPELAAHLAEDEPEVAAAALSQAQLSDEDWETLIPRLPVRARGFLRLRRNLSEPTRELLERLGVHDRALPEPDAERTEERSRPVPTVTANDGPDSYEEEAPNGTAIGTLVKRIEAFQRTRSRREDAPRLPLGEDAGDDSSDVATGFSFTTNFARRIDWAEPRYAPMLIGTSLAQSKIADAMKLHQVIRGGRVTLDGAPMIAGEWLVEMQPRFSQPGGRFVGYAGLARRRVKPDSELQTSSESREADRLRQLLHELRTPVNAIQGFSEVIQQQLFGPTPNEYRALAAGIAGDAARMLAGFDELDRLAKLETGALELDAGETDFAAIIERLVQQLQDVLKPRTAGLEFTTYENGVVPIQTDDAEALAWRLLATLVGAMGGGEHLQVELSARNDILLLSCELPAVLAGKPDVFAASGKPDQRALSAGMFGTGFSLRLARAEARAIGGELERVDDWLMLGLPLLTDAGREPSSSSAG